MSNWSSRVRDRLSDFFYEVFPVRSGCICQCVELVRDGAFVSGCDCVVAKIEAPSCSQHVSFSPFYVNSPETSLMRFSTSRLDRTRDLDVFALLSSHIRKESAEWKSDAPRLFRSVPNGNLLQICNTESSRNRSEYEEENDKFAETKL